MRNEHDEQLDRLFRAARMLQPRTTELEDRFETRLVARMEERSHNRATWGFWAWRLVPVFAAIVLLIGIGSVVIHPAPSGDLFAALAGNGYDDYTVSSLIAGGVDEN